MTTLTDCVIARWTLLVAAPIDRHGVGERLGAAYENQMVKARGATTMWEWWEGIDADGQPHESLNHYSKGAVIGFLHRYTAGIRLGDEPAYRTFTIAPMPGGGLTSASAAHESPYGRIESSWTLEGSTLHVDVLVPPGTTADVVLPGRVPQRVGAGRHSFSRFDNA